MTLIIDRYECYGCGKDVEPCQITIPHTDNKLPSHLKGREKFMKRVCICDNEPDVRTDWQKVDEFSPLKIETE